MPERSDRHGWIDLLVPDGPFLSAAALDVQTVGENWPTRLSAEQRRLLTAPPTSEAEEGEGWDDSSWDGRRARVTELLTELLGYREGKTLAVAPGVAAHHHIYRARVSADFVIHAADDPDDARMVVICGPDATDDPSRLDPARTHTHDGWVSTPVQRAALLARHADADLALVTNGREHLLVNVVTGTTGSAMWTLNGLEDRRARDAFVALLHKQRVLHRTVPLSRLIELSQDRQHELTDTLGKQVRRAAEALVNSISRANRTSRGRLLEGLTGQQVYAATTRVLMRTVFLLVAEERGLLPVAENQLFADQYAMSTLLDKLEEDAYRNRSAMERRAGAWQRMMALSRAVHAGIEHDDLRLPAYGGNFFDPDEHPFLEARITAADGEEFEKLDVGVVDDFTVLTVLRHLQIADGQRISFRSLDVEQIGHVYEALLDHSAVIVPEDQVAVLGLIGKAGDEPEVSLVELEGWTAKSDKELGKQLVDLGVAAEARGIYQAIDDGLAPDSEVAQTLNVAVANDPALRERVERYAPLLRTDARGIAQVFRPGDVYVTETSSKRDSGTAYTPRSLAEEIAKHTLDPLIYDPGPQNEPDESKWKLKTPEQILDLKICDPAVGSAAILVAAVRYLAEALLQARVDAGELSPEALASGAADLESVDARVHARRAIVSRCAYGVDRDRMAVEMAKLSLWLITMARDTPFTFLDHAIRHGDSLLGITTLKQLRRLHLDEGTDIFGLQGGGLFSSEAVYQWQSTIESALERMLEGRRKLRATTAERIEDTEYQNRLHSEAERATSHLRVTANAIVANCLTHAGDPTRTASSLAALSSQVDELVHNDELARRIDERARAAANRENPSPEIPRVFLHWPLAFPEVFERANPGFDGMLGNPPFLGGTRISTSYGGPYRQTLAQYIVGQGTNRADLVVFFFRRCWELIRDAGTTGFIATQAIRSGASREHGLGWLTGEGAVIYRASALAEWPGQAGVHVSKVWLSKKGWTAGACLDGAVIEEISAALEPALAISGEPQEVNGELALQGCKPTGRGFLLSDQEASELIEADAREAEVVRRYAGGRDVYGPVTPTPSSWIAYFADMDEGEARTFETFDVIVPRVSSERAGKKRLDRIGAWQFEHAAVRLFTRLEDFDEVLVFGYLSKTLFPVFAPAHWLYADTVVVTFLDQPWHYAVLGSPAHYHWVLQFGTRMRAAPRYQPSRVLETFPFPEPTAALDEAGGSLRECVDETQRQLEVGPTKLLTAINDPSSNDPPIVNCRNRLQQTWSATADAYGWSDLAGEVLGLYDAADQGLRWTLPPEAAHEVLARLLRMNQARSGASS